MGPLHQISRYQSVALLLLLTGTIQASPREKNLRGRDLTILQAECAESIISGIAERIQERRENRRDRREHNNDNRDLRFWNFPLITNLVNGNNETDTETNTTEIEGVEGDPNATQPTELDGTAVDVVIIGAGMAGIAAAMELQETDPDLTYVILESTDRTGGRVRSHTMGAPGREVVVEDGANWIIPFNGNPLWERAQEMSLGGMENDWTDWTVYDSSGNLVDPDLVQQELQRFEQAFDKAAQDADEQFSKNHEDFDDRGVLALLAENGWTVGADSLGDLDYIMQWSYIDFEYAVADVSSRYFPYSADNPYLVTDSRGYETVLNDMRDQNIPPENIKLNTRVLSIDYGQDICMNSCLGICVGDSYKALVTSEDGTKYYGKRVISTVSSGVINNDLISFTPPLAYPPADYSPYYMAQYVKIFYQFEESFWDTTEFTEVTLSPPNRGHCHHWHNMELAIPGSGIIRCELMTEGFMDLIDADTQELSAETLDSLLDPLRAVYGTDVVGTPIDVYYPKLNKDPDFGFGAYSAWKIGTSFTSFAHFFGGIPELTESCDHNGCNDDGDWIFHISGSASCYEYAEFVHGGFFSGQRSARNVLASLGYDVETGNTGCDQWWNELQGFAVFQPSETPTNAPTQAATEQPTRKPSSSPSSDPSEAPTAEPSGAPSAQPTSTPSSEPSSVPSSKPSGAPSETPTNAPTPVPSWSPSSDPSSGPTPAPLPTTNMIGNSFFNSADDRGWPFP